MLSRKEMLRSMAALPVGGYLAGKLGLAESIGRPGASLGPTADSIYRSVGAKPLINARGTVTIIGATRVLPEVQEAMDRAVREYVQLDELMEGVGERLGALTGTEFGMVSAGASAAITAATAGIISGGDPDRIWQLPDLSGLKNEVIIPTYSRSAYDAAARAVGATMVPVADVEELEAALGPRTAMVMVLASGRSNDGPLSLREISERAHASGVPVLVDAAAEELRVPNPHIEQGADLVAYSGGKSLRGPQCAGLLIGRKDLVWASWISVAPHHGFGRGFKVGREEIMGMLAAVETWFTRDHDAEQARWLAWLEQIAQQAGSIRGVETEVRPAGDRLSNRYPGLTISWDRDRIDLAGHEMEQALWDGDPGIAVSGAGSFLPFPPNEQPAIRINVSQMEEWEVSIVADRVRGVLENPPSINRDRQAPAEDLSGQWDLVLSFSASDVDQTLTFQQEGAELLGTHFASFADRDLAGYLSGREILFRSSYTGEGVRLNYTFTGTVDGDTMHGDVCMGEYGTASWRAKRRVYRPAGRRG
ncbi:MAG: aminotransferase class V-fold PLP-dependent enzyme [Balneolaceae bacterium]